MPTRIGSTLGSYDLFAKTIPGVMFFIGFVSVLPSLPELPNQRIGFGFITVVIVTTVVAGLVIGQGLHSVAVAVEIFFYRITTLLYSHSRLVRREHWSSREGISYSISDYDKENTNVICRYLRTIFTVLLRVPAQTYCWFIGRVHEVVLPHRVWFKYRLQREFQDKENPDGLYEWFKWECRDHLESMEMDLVDQYEKVYRFVMSYLGFIEGGRARKFQATSSFCRSAWITLLAFAILYSIILKAGPEQILGYSPVIQPYLDRYGYQIPVGLFVGSVLFMYSSGQYKKHFTEYIVVDFYNIVGSDAGTDKVELDVDKLEIDINDKK